jgi:hypothetical protein
MLCFSFILIIIKLNVILHIILYNKIINIFWKSSHKFSPNGYLICIKPIFFIIFIKFHILFTIYKNLLSLILWHKAPFTLLLKFRITRYSIKNNINFLRFNIIILFNYLLTKCFIYFYFSFTLGNIIIN